MATTKPNQRHKPQKQQAQQQPTEQQESGSFQYHVKCEHCGMLFASTYSLSLHEQKFCVTLLDSGRLKANNANEQKNAFTTRSNESNVNDDLRYNLNPVKTRSAIDELKYYKTRKSIEQTIQDFEDTLVRDTIRDRKLANSLHSTPTSVKTNSNPANPYKDLFKRYAEFKKKEKDILKDIYDYNPDFKPLRMESNEQENSSAIDFLDLFDQTDTTDIDEIDTEYLKSLTFIDKNNSNNSSHNTTTISKTFTTTTNNNNINKNKNKNNTNKKKREDLINNSPQQTVTTTNKMNDETRRNLKRIQDKTIELERERREIQFKLEALKNDTSYPLTVSSNQSLNRILNELKSQQKINEAALNMLRQRLTTNASDPMINNSTTSLRSSLGMLPPIYSSSSNEYLSGYLANIYDSTLSPEDIRLMRLNYLQNGGHDQHILNKFTEMEYNARYKQSSNRNVRDPILYDPLTIDLENKIRKVDMDNKRLQSEIELLQEKYESIVDGNNMTFDSLRKYTDSALPPIRNVPSQMNRSTSRTKYVPIQETVPNLMVQSQRDQNDEPPMSYRNENANTMRTVRLKDLPPAPYDPVGGFVIFIDFVMYLDPSFGCARVVTCLHHPKSGLGEPSVLPIVNCESYAESGRRISIALISTKQPVPRCPPQQALTVLLELQMAYRDVNDSRLKSCAWCKIPLFDSKNRLLSGRWRSRLKVLPIRSDVNLSVVESFPDFENAELYYRLVNVRDADEQTNAPISPVYADQYAQTSVY